MAGPGQEIGLEKHEKTWKTQKNHEQTWKTMKKHENIWNIWGKCAIVSEFIEVLWLSDLGNTKKYDISQKLLWISPTPLDVLD